MLINNAQYTRAAYNYSYIWYKLYTHREAIILRTSAQYIIFTKNWTHATVIGGKSKEPNADMLEVTSCNTTLVNPSRNLLVMRFIDGCKFIIDIDNFVNMQYHTYIIINSTIIRMRLQSRTRMVINNTLL